MAPATAKATPTKGKTAGAGVKKAGRPPGKGRKGKASQAMAKMQAYCECLRFLLLVISRLGRVATRYPSCDCNFASCPSFGSYSPISR